MKRKISAVLISILLLCSASACGRKQIQLQDFPVLNYTAPQEGEEIIVLHIKDYGNVKIKLFPDLLPEACENFVTLAEQGYYDESIFHRVIKDFMIQGGDPKGDGTGGESCWGGKFDGGVSQNLIHVPGAIGYANGGSTADDGSQFYLVIGAPVGNDMLNELVENYDMYFSQQAEAYYTQYGGTPYLDGGYTVFGQVIDGLDIVWQISQTETDTSDKPKKAVYIESITTEQYDNSPLRWYPADYGL